MARKKGAAENGSPVPVLDTVDVVPAAGASDSRPNPVYDVVMANASAERDAVKVNNMNLVDLKNACDDAAKRLLSHKDLFSTINTHTDVKLALGWASVFIAAGTAFYGYKVEFETSKPVVWAGVILYMLLTSLQTLYVQFVEKDTIYTGRRKVLAKRIETERIIVSSRTIPSNPTAAQPAPLYSLNVSYVRSSNHGKSLLGKAVVEGTKSYNDFFDDNGMLEQDIFERWVAGLVGGVMDNAKSE